MKVLEYSAHNVLCLSDIKFDLRGHHLFLVGGHNGNGKTSSLRALLMAICGKSGMDYPMPALKTGEKEGWVKIKLSGDEAAGFHGPHEVQLYLKKNRDGAVVEKLIVQDSAGDKAGSPRKLLQDLYHAKAFDPLGFERLDKKQQRETLMKLVGLDLDKFKEQRESLYEQRRDTKKSADREQVRFDSMPYFADAPDSAPVVHELMDVQKDIQEHNLKIKDAGQLVSAVKKSVSESESEVSRLTEELKKEKALLKDRVTALNDAENAVVDLGEPKDENEILDHIKSAGEISEMVSANDRRDAALRDLSELKAQSESLTDKIADLDEAQDKEIKGADWPVPGLGVDDEGVLLDGLPYESASKSQRVMASTRMGIAMNPTLRLLVCEDGSDLDTETLKALDELLKEEDFTMLVELVTRTEADEDLCQVVIEDGAVRTESAKS